MANWFRFYDDAVNDPKIIELPDDLFRAWVNLLCIAAKNDGVLPEMKHVALVLRTKPQKAAALVTRLVMQGLIDNHNGVFAPHNWQGRQFKSDDSGPRVKKHREKLRNAKGNAECNVTCNGESNALEGEEKKIEGEQSRADTPAAVDEDLRKRASALGISVSLQFSTRGYPVPILDRCEHWLRTGYAPGTVLKAVENVLKRGKPIATLDYFDGAIRDAHGKDPAPSVGDKPALVSVFVEVGTPEWSCWESEHKRLGRRPPFVRDTTIDGVVKSGWWFKSSIPDGYDPCTYEYTPPKSDEAAA